MTDEPTDSLVRLSSTDPNTMQNKATVLFMGQTPSTINNICTTTAIDGAADDSMNNSNGKTIETSMGRLYNGG